MLPEDGQTVLPAEKMTFSLEKDLLTVRLTHASGETQELLLALRAGGEAEK